MGNSFFKPNTPGFTIVEIIVVIAVIAILATLTTIAYTVITDDTRIKAVETDIQNTAAAIGTYRSQNGGYPTSSAEFTNGVEQSNSSGDTTYNYTYLSAAGGFCLVATGHNTTFNMTSLGGTVNPGGSCPVLAVPFAATSPTDVMAPTNTSITVSGTGTPGNSLRGALCIATGQGFSAGQRCLVSSAVSTTVAANGTWSMNILFTDFWTTSRTILNTGTSVTTNTNCSGIGQCEFHILDFGTNTAPTAITQAVGSDTIPAYAEIN